MPAPRLALALCLAPAALANDPPTLTCPLGTEVRIEVGSTLEVTVDVTDPDGDPVTLLLESVPEGFPFLEARGVAAPHRHETFWLPPRKLGAHDLTFLAYDAAHASAPTRLSLRVVVGEGEHVWTGDVTGDGVPDLITGARYADVLGVKNAGAVHVWSGAVMSAAPSATLVLATPSEDDFLPSTNTTLGLDAAVRLADVTGDGVLDVVALASQADVAGVPDAGTVAVFAGGPGLVGLVRPRATLVRATPSAGDLLGTSDTPALVCADIDADGVDDVLCACSAMSAGGAGNAGGVLAWRGGPTLKGQVAALELTARIPTLSDRVGTSLHLVDVTGDGHADVVAGSLLRVDGIPLEGAILVWAGGPGFGTKAKPTATLRRATPAMADSFGTPNAFADLDGDGALDVIAVAAADPSSPNTTGVLVWKGGAGLAGEVVSDAALTTPDVKSGWFPSLGIADVTGDGRLDVLLGCPSARVAGISDAGAVYVWSAAGGASGARPPQAVLARPTPVSGDALAISGLRLGLVDGDDVLDVLAGSYLIEVADAAKVGELYLWPGGPGFVSVQKPWATLAAVGAVADSRLGVSVRLGDVTGDGRADVVATGYAAPGSSTPCHLWTSDLLTAGRIGPDASLDGAALLNDLELLDLDGDGLRDVLGTSRVSADTQRLDVWTGRASWPTNAAVDVALTAGGLPIHEEATWWFADLDGDGLRDVATLSERNSVGEGRTILVWCSRASFAGTTPPTFELTDPDHQPDDTLGYDIRSGNAVLVRDLDGDGKLDVLATTSDADKNGLKDVGALQEWRGPLTGTAPTLKRYDPAASPKDRLGY